MAYVNFAVGANNYTVSNQALAGRNAASAANWNMDAWAKLFAQSVELTEEPVVGSPSVDTYKTWWGKAGLYLYTN